MADRELSWSVVGGGLMRLVNFHLGGALYTIPRIALDAGLQKMVVLLVTSAGLTLLVYEYLARMAIHTQQGSLSRIVEAVLGRFAAIGLRILVVLNAIGVVAAYIATVFDVGEAVGGAFTFRSSPGTCFASTLIGGVIAVVLLEARLPDVADWGSLLANLSLSVLIAVLFWMPASRAQEASHMPPSWWRVAVDFGPSLVFAFSSAEYVLRACDVADDNGALLPGVDATRVLRRIRVIGGASVAISTALYAVMGIGGIQAFGQDLKEDILSNFSSPTMLSAIVLSTNAVSLLLSLPVFVEALLLYLCELLQEVLSIGIYAKMVQGNWLLNPSRPFVASVWIIPVAWALMQLSPGLRHIINLASSATDYYFMFVLPPLSYIVASPQADGRARWVLTSVGVPLALLALIMGMVSFKAALA